MPPDIFTRWHCCKRGGYQNLTAKVIPAVGTTVVPVWARTKPTSVFKGIFTCLFLLFIGGTTLELFGKILI